MNTKKTLSLIVVFSITISSNSFAQEKYCKDFVTKLLQNDANRPGNGLPKSVGIMDFDHPPGNKILQNDGSYKLTSYYDLYSFPHQYPHHDITVQPQDNQGNSVITLDDGKTLTKDNAIQATGGIAVVKFSLNSDCKLEKLTRTRMIADESVVINGDKRGQYKVAETVNSALCSDLSSNWEQMGKNKGDHWTIGGKTAPTAKDPTPQQVADLQSKSGIDLTETVKSHRWHDLLDLCKEYFGNSRVQSTAPTPVSSPSPSPSDDGATEAK